MTHKFLTYDEYMNMDAFELLSKDLPRTVCGHGILFGMLSRFFNAL